MQELYDLGIAHKEDVVPYYPRVRDRDDVGVLRDEKTGVIFLNRTDHIGIEHYDEMDGVSYWKAKSADGHALPTTREEALEAYKEDDVRRAAYYEKQLAAKEVVDVGCGTGGFMDRIRATAKSISGVEPQAYVRGELEKLGYPMYRLPSDAPPDSFDVATLFCTLEHILEPLKTLKEVRTMLKPGGMVIIEVPHARDVLLKLEAFKAFTLWSEHIVLHTKESLRTYLEAAGFKDVVVEGTQRYPLGNHIGWFLEGKPGGQKRHTEFTSLAERYERLLIDSDQTDTLTAYARK